MLGTEGGPGHGLAGCLEPLGRFGGRKSLWVPHDEQRSSELVNMAPNPGKPECIHSFIHSFTFEENQSELVHRFCENIGDLYLVASGRKEAFHDLAHAHFVLSHLIPVACRYCVA